MWEKVFLAAAVGFAVDFVLRISERQKKAGVRELSKAARHWMFLGLLALICLAVLGLALR